MVPFLMFNLEDFLYYIAGIVSSVGIILGGMKGVSLFFGKRIKKKEKEKTDALRKIIQQDIKSAMQPEFDKLHRADEEIDKKITLLNVSNRDLLRTNIERIYSKYKRDKKITETDREILDKLYKDYRDEGGNGRIERMYLRTVNWEVVDDDEY